MRRRTISLISVLAFGLFALAAEAQTMQAPKPGPEVKKMSVFVGHFTDNGEAKPGAMGPNSPATKLSSTNDCSWTAGGFALLCRETSRMGAMKTNTTALMYYDPSDKTYHYTEVDSAGDVGESTGSVDGDTWTWTGKGSMGGHVMYTKFTMKNVSNNGFEWTMAGGDSQSSMQEGMKGKSTRVRTAMEPAVSK